MSNSPQSSPLINLRQYRFQKDSQRSLSAASNGTSGKNGLSNNIIARPSSSATAEKLSPGGAYKRIRIMDSESENETASPVKKVAAVEVDKPTQDRRLNNMILMFPDVSSMIVKTVLIKHKWNEERSRDELLSLDPEQAEINKSVNNPRFQNEYIDMLKKNLNGAVNGAVNRASAINYANVKKKKSKRKGSDAGSDSDFDNHHHNDDKVFDSDDDSETEISNDLIGDKKKVFEFLSGAKMSELQQLQGCSLKKVEAIMSIRPFKGWVDLVSKLFIDQAQLEDTLSIVLVEKFQNNKHLNTDILNAAQDLLVTRNNILKLMKKCTSLATQLESAVAAGAGVKKQPAILDSNLTLAAYQMVGLNWLAVLHAQKVNGILADEMGLGKTVQVIAFLAHLKETKMAEGTHLIVVPSSTLDNWNIEFTRWCPSMRVAVYYGNQDERRSLRISWARGGLSEVDVVLTTYNLVSSCPEERKMFRVTPMHYIVFDEAHMLKNMATQRYENLIRIKATHRILLTGTPLQNNLLELMSLLCFVMPNLFANNTEDLKSLFQKNSKGTKKASEKNADVEDVPAFEQTQISQAKRIMKPFVLRRLKRDVLKDLPNKMEHLILVPMIASQNSCYTNLIQSFSASDGQIHATNENSGMSMMMDMRKLANHPLLLRYFYDETRLRRMADYLSADSLYKENNATYILQDLLCMSDFQIHQLTFQYKSIINMKVPDELIVRSGKFSKLDEMLPKLKAEGHRVLIFSQFVMMLDILEPYLKLRKYNYLRLDGQTAVTLRQDLIDQYNQQSDIFIFLLSTKAGGLGINLTAADTVIIHDIDFNPYNDKQAEDRCHRMGQKRPVTIYRFVSVGTIEEGIYQVAQEKLSLERDITNVDENEPQEMKNVVRLLNSALGLVSSAK